MLWSMRWVDSETIKTVILGVSALVSLLALFVAFRAYRANYRLAERVANQAGRLHSAHIGVTHGHTELVAVNGPSGVTIKDVALEVIYRKSVNSFAVQQVTVYLGTFDMLQEEFQLTGPRPPIRVEPYDLVVWKFPRWHDLVCDGHQLAYRFTVETAHMDKATSSDFRRFGFHVAGVRRHSSTSSGLSSIFNNKMVPTEMVSWAKAVLNRKLDELI
jgi:hypothetical protein